MCKACGKLGGSKGMLPRGNLDFFSVKAKRVYLLRYGNPLMMTPGILITEGQPCPTSSEFGSHKRWGHIVSL